MDLVEELHAVAGALATAGIPYAICGGIAVTAWGAPRLTKDIDLLVYRSDIGRVLDAVKPLGFTIPALPMVFDAGSAAERHVQRVSKLAGSQHLVLDLLFAELGFANALDDRVEVALPSGMLWFVSRDTLVRMKRLAGRPIDQQDLQSLGVDDAK